MVHRRSFLKQCGAGALGLSSLSEWTTGYAKSNPTSSVLVEASRFEEKGGWTHDTQFFDELGFSYLLAHGLGKPVENARTRATFPKTGRYHLWVRTKNWAAGDWAPPGQFEVLVGGHKVETVFGTEPGWAWQSGGTLEIAEGETPVELRDLTGFEGRCDALFFSPDASDVPPNDRETLEAWRREKLGMPDTPETSREFDVVVVGGGIAGCGAALAAESEGLKVALIQDRPLFGGNSSQEIRVHTLGLHGKRKDIIESIDSEHWPNGSPKAVEDDRKRHASMDAAKGIEQYLGHSVYSVQKEGDRIRSVDAFEFESGVARRFVAPVFIDCTGDGWLGYWAGAEYRYGRESKDEFGEGWDEQGDLWSPAKPDNKVMGSSVLWRSFEAEGPAEFPPVPWAEPVACGHEEINGEWYWEFSSDDTHQVRDAEEIRDHMLRAIYGSFSNAKKHPKHARRELEWVSHLVGKRESRRIMGDYIYTMADAVESRHFPDTVVIEKREVDVHFQLAEKGHAADFLSKAMYRKPKEEFYYLPFRTLYSKDIENLMMAGRCFSCSHIGLGGPRVMLTCGQMGVAVGFASVLCAKHGTTPRTVGKEHIGELRKLCGYT